MAQGQVITDWFSSGYGPPVSSPDLTSSQRWAAYQDTTTGDMWFWNLYTNAWELFVTAGDGLMPLSIAVVNYTGADIAFTNSSWAILASAFTVTMTTGAHRVLVMWNFGGQVSGSLAELDVVIDGVGTGNTRGVWYTNITTEGPLVGHWLSPVLSAGSHTIALYAKCEGGVTLGIGAGTTGVVAQMSVIEQAA
jgi:hypothetical protein